MDNNKITALYDDGNIPRIDQPQRNTGDLTVHISDRFYECEKHEKQKNSDNAERLPESTRSRQDGPGGA